MMISHEYMSEISKRLRLQIDTNWLLHWDRAAEIPRGHTRKGWAKNCISAYFCIKVHIIKDWSVAILQDSDSEEWRSLLWNHRACSIRQDVAVQQNITEPHLNSSDVHANVRCMSDKYYVRPCHNISILYSIEFYKYIVNFVYNMFGQRTFHNLGLSLWNSSCQVRDLTDRHGDRGTGKTEHRKKRMNISGKSVKKG